MITLRSLLGCLLLSLATPAAWAAATLDISPMAASLAPQQRTAEIRVTNRGQSAVAVQASLEAWAQEAGGADRHTPTADLVVFPKIFELQPGQSQTVRIGRNAAASNQEPERAYRLFLLELPRNDDGQPQVGMNLRISLPVWLRPAKAVSDWSLPPPQREQDKAVLALANEGNAHVRVKKFRLEALDGAGQIHASAERSGWYVLAGSTGRFALDLPAGFCGKASQLRLTTQVEATEPRTAQWPAVALCGG